MSSNFGLLVVASEANKVDGDSVGGDKVGETEEWIEVALNWKRDCYNCYLVMLVSTMITNMGSHSYFLG